METRYSLIHLSDFDLQRELPVLTARERNATAVVLAHIAEFDARRLYLPAAYPSMAAYCVGALGFTEDAAAERIQAARTAREFPALFEAVADGRLHLSAVCLLAAHLTSENVDELVSTAAAKSKFQIERLIADKRASAATGELELAEHAPGHVGETPIEPCGDRAGDLAPLRPQPEHAPGHVDVHAKRIPIRLMLRPEDEQMLRYAQALFSHCGWARDRGQVFSRALELFVRQGERRRFGAAGGRRSRAFQSRPTRHIPMHIRAAVWQRDGGQCTFESESGRRCEARSMLQFDHIVPVARIGASTFGNLRLRCRAHNQYGAEQAFGRAFMETRREQSRAAAAQRKQQRAAAAEAPPLAAAELQARAAEEREAAWP